MKDNQEVNERISDRQFPNHGDRKWIHYYVWVFISNFLRLVLRYMYLAFIFLSFVNKRFLSKFFWLRIYDSKNRLTWHILKVRVRVCLCCRVCTFACVLDLRYSLVLVYLNWYLLCLTGRKFRLYLSTNILYALLSLFFSFFLQAALNINQSC